IRPAREAERPAGRVAVRRAERGRVLRPRRRGTLAAGHVDLSGSVLRRPRRTGVTLRPLRADLALGPLRARLALRADVALRAGVALRALRARVALRPGDGSAELADVARLARLARRDRQDQPRLLVDAERTGKPPAQILRAAASGERDPRDHHGSERPQN